MLQMSYGSLTDFWQRFGVSVGNDAGSNSNTSRSLVEDVGGNTSRREDEGEVTTTSAPLDQKLQSLVDRFVSSIEKKDWKDSGYYISDVYACESTARANAVAKRLAERAESFGRGLIGISIHGDHVHSIHSCPYASRTCRCFFKNFPEAKEDIRRLLRKPRAIETFTRRDWENITKYFCTRGRRATYFKVYGAVQRIPLEITALSNTAVSGEDGGGQDPSLEDCQDPFEYDSRSERESIPENPGAKRRRKRRDTITVGGERGVGGTTGIILELLNRCAVCPISEIVYTLEYLTNPDVCTKRLDSKEVKDAIDTRCSIINTWEREDYVKWYNDVNTIKIWSARSVQDFDIYYLSYFESMAVIEDLLVFQMGGEIDRFCTDLINILEKRLPKRNCFVIVSPPSAGKNFLCDGIRDYFLNTGQMNNPNKYNQFAYQDCPNRRLIIWNEPNYEARETENLKMLFGGDNLSANVKCKPQSNVKRTPVIVTSNNYPHFVKQSAFADRVILYNWKPAGQLKDIHKKPLPTAVMDVLYSHYIQ